MTNIPAADLGFIQETLYVLGREVVDAFEDNPKPGYPTPPAVLIESLDRLLVLLANLHEHTIDTVTEEEQIVPEHQGINNFADYGLKMLVDLAAWAKILDLPDVYDGLQRICFAFGLWLAQHEAEITQLEPLVDYLGILASTLSKPAELEQAYVVASQIMDAVNPLLIQEDANHSQRPWYNLLLIRAIIAARSNHPSLVAQAFRSLADAAPEDVPGFLQRITLETDNLQLSEATNLVMEKYLHSWRGVVRLH